MFILLTNDDGIDAPGIRALQESLSRLAKVAVVAPATEQSGVGHGISVQQPMIVERTKAFGDCEGWSVAGRPADCVKLAMLHLLSRRPDFVVSGINAGLNTSRYTRYSGTVAAAAEAVMFFGIPSMAVSLECAEVMDFKAAARIASCIFEQYLAANPTCESCISVNIPALGQGRPRGIRVCRPSTLTTRTIYTSEIDERGRRVFRFGGGDPSKTAQPGTDSQAVLDGYVALTPLRFDSGDERLISELAARSWGLPTKEKTE